MGIHLKEGTIVIPYSNSVAGKLHGHLPQQADTMDYFVGQWRYRNKIYGDLIVLHLRKDYIVAQFYNHKLCGEYLAHRTEFSGLPRAKKQKEIAKKLAAAELCNALAKAARYKLSQPIRTSAQAQAL